MPASVATADELAAIEARIAALEASHPHPVAPTGLTATAGASPNTVDLAWVGIQGSSGYMLRSRSSYDPPGHINELGVIAATSSLRGPLPAGTHTWWVTAIVAGMESAPSNEATATTGTGTPGGGPPATDAPLGATLFADDFASGLSSQWYALQSVGVHRGAPVTPPSHPSFAIVDDGPDHPHVARFVRRPEDSNRVELLLPTSTDYDEGDVRWVSFDFKVDVSTPTPNTQWTILMQWHAGDGSPPVCLELDNRDRLVLRNNVLNWALPVAAADKGVWHRYDIGTLFRNDSSGWVHVFRDGVEALPRTSRRTMSTGGGYGKIGVYTSGSVTSTTYVGRFVVSGDVG